MSDEKRIYNKHAVNIENREKITVTGVIDVSSFDEETISAETSMGFLTVKGENLHINKLNLDSGELLIDGNVNSVFYNIIKDKKAKTSLFNKMFK